MKRGMGSKVLWAVIAVQLTIGGVSLATADAKPQPVPAPLVQEPNAGVETYSPGPPRPGTYPRKFTSERISSVGYPNNSDTPRQEAEDSFRVEIVDSGGANLVRYHSSEEPSYRSYRDVDWRAAGSFEVVEVVESSGPDHEEQRSIRDECRWHPENPELAFPIGVGRAWSWDVSCA